MYVMLSYASALLRKNSESVETTVRRRMLLFAGFLCDTHGRGASAEEDDVFGEMVGGKGYSGGQEW